MMTICSAQKDEKRGGKRGERTATHYKVNPPSGVIDEPVMYFDSSDAR